MKNNFNYFQNIKLKVYESFILSIFNRLKKM